MVLRINNVRISLTGEQTLKEAAARKLGVKKQDLGKVRVLRRAVDARRKSNIVINYHLLAELDAPARLVNRLLRDKDVTRFKEEKAAPPVMGEEKITDRPVVIGAGPAGLVAALELARYGYKPLLLERGKKIAARVDDVQRFWQKGEFNPDSNVQFGEGGAGTFSDGKLTTRVNDPVMNDILKLFVQAGAPEEILWEQKPHVGTDKLRAMVAGLNKMICELGGEIRFETRAADFIVEGNAVKGVITQTGEKIYAPAVILACGHSARDTYEVLAQHKIAVEAKAFAIGVRIEHPQELIDRAQYGSFAGHAKLGAADYAVVWHRPDSSRTAYSFCMCPGGQVVGAASETGGVVVNGMSMYKRDSGIANSALVVNVTPDDFGHNALDGVEFQRRWERLAFKAGGGNYYAPAQNFKTFLDGAAPSVESLVNPSCRPGIKACDLNAVLPEYITSTLRGGIQAFGQRLTGFDDGGALLTGVETRTSAPLRIMRGDDKQSVSHKGLYPCGEGAGYAGGIMSAALDGYHVARAVMARFAPF